MGSSAQQYADNGLILSKASLTVGDEIEISYSGLLAKSGADQIFAHVGYGENWDNKEFILMENEGGVFKVAYKILFSGVLNIAFKDRGDNWDNNSSNNYSFKVSGKEKKVTAKKAVEAVEAVVEAVEKAVVKKTAAKKTASKEKADTEKSAAKTTAEKKTTTAKKTAAGSTKAKKTTDKEKAPAKKKEE